MPQRDLRDAILERDIPIGSAQLLAELHFKVEVCLGVAISGYHLRDGQIARPGYRRRSLTIDENRIGRLVGDDPAILVYCRGNVPLLIRLQLADDILRACRQIRDHDALAVF